MELGQFESNGNYVLQYMGSADGGGKTALQFAIWQKNWGWPKPCKYTVYDRIFGDFPARNTVYTPCIISGQP